MSNKNKYQDELANIMDSLAESVLEIPDEEIEEELKEEGDDTETVRQILLTAIKSCRQKSLHEAKERYEANSRLFRETKYDIPESPGEKRELIQSMLESFRFQNQSSLTLQFRDYENLPDEDLDGVLQQLLALKSIEKSNE